MEKMTPVKTEATSAVKKAFLRLHGDSTLLSEVRIIVPIRPEEAAAKTRHACPVWRWFLDS
ncbi:MAG: hypothetical protein WAO22_00950 [bacterium]|jgi:hypothetical protein|nr:hypothetical protein [Bacillota bacterium]